MSLNSANNPNVLNVQLGAITADAQFELFKLAAYRKILVRNFRLIDPTGIAAHATDFVKFQLKSGSTVLAEWSTETGQEGAMTAATWVQAPESEVSHAAGSTAEKVVLIVDIAASGATNAKCAAAVEFIFE